MDFKNNIEKRVIRVFLLMLAVLVLVVLAAEHYRRQLITARDWVNHTHAVILKAEAIISSLNAGDSALRSYLLTDNKRDQGSYRTEYNEMKRHLEDALDLTRADKLQHKELLKLEELLGKRINFTRSVVAAYDQQGLDQDKRLEEARKVLKADATGESLGAIQLQIQKVKQEENINLIARDKEAYLAAQAMRWTILIGIAIDFLLLVVVGWLIRDDIAARRRAATALEEANAQLEIKVQERTADLVTANQSLKVENLERQWSNQALTHQLRYDQLIINSIGDLIFVISRALHISRINPAVVHQTQIEAPELIRRSIGEVVQLSTNGVAGAALTENAFALAMKEGREIQERLGILCCKGGQALPVRLTLVPLRDQDQVVGGVLTVTLCQDGAPQARVTDACPK